MDSPSSRSTRSRPVPLGSTAAAGSRSSASTVPPVTSRRGDLALRPPDRRSSLICVNGSSCDKGTDDGTIVVRVDAQGGTGVVVVDVQLIDTDPDGQLGEDAGQVAWTQTAPATTLKASATSLSAAASGSAPAALLIEVLNAKGDRVSGIPVTVVTRCSLESCGVRSRHWGRQRAARASAPYRCDRSRVPRGRRCRRWRASRPPIGASCYRIAPRPARRRSIRLPNAARRTIAGAAGPGRR